MNQLVETIKLIAKKYPDISAEIDGNIVRLKICIDNTEYKNLEIEENKSKLKVSIYADNINELEKLILIFSNTK